MVNAQEKLIILQRLSKINEHDVQVSTSFRRLERLHEKLTSRKHSLSLPGAIKLYRSYLNAFQLLEKHYSIVEDVLHVVDAQIVLQEASKKKISSSNEQLEHRTTGNDIIVQKNNLSFEGATTDTDKIQVETNSPLEYPQVSELPISYQLKPGQTVAALCRADNNSDNEDWILATVVHRIPSSTSEGGEDEYEVEDIDLDDPSLELPGMSSLKASPHKNMSKRAKRFTVRLEKLRYIPSDEESISKIIESIRTRQRVLALFPGTTCLYPATVLNCPSKRRKVREFVVKFLDDDAPSRNVAARFVVPN